jgi:hypothetical protein
MRKHGKKWNQLCEDRGGVKPSPLGYVYIPYVKGVSEKFKRIGNRYNVRTIFRMKHSQEFTHENQAEHRSATDGRVWTFVFK